MYKKILLFIIILIIISQKYTIIEDTPDIQPVSPAPQTEVTVTLAAAGDNLIHSPIYKQAHERAGNGYDFSPVYSDVKSIIEENDISIINQETPLGGTELGLSSYPLFNSPQQLGDDLVSAGFDIVNHANNHIMDAGIYGVENTLSYWKSKKIPVTGVYEKGDNPIKYISKNGITFAFLSYTYGTNDIQIPDSSSFSVSIMDKQLIETEVKTAKLTADIVIINMHWGNENQMFPNEQQREYARFAASLNVDLLIGHHPHVLQQTEVIKRADNKDMVVAYSLGNFVSCQNGAENIPGGILTAEFKGVKGNMNINKLEIIPIITHYENKYSNVKIYLWKNYSKELALSHGCRNFDNNFSYSYIKDIIANIID